MTTESVIALALYTLKGATMILLCGLGLYDLVVYQIRVEIQQK